MIGRRRYLEAVGGTVLTVTTGCLAANDRTAASKTSTVETTVPTTKTSTSSETEQTTSRATTERTIAQTTETDGVRGVPTVSFTFEYAKEAETSEVAITHAGGDAIAGNRVTVTIDGTVAFQKGDVVTSNYRAVTNEWSETVTTDDTLAVRDGQGREIAEWQTVEVKWTPENGDDSVLVARSTVRH